ncbi:hypothetical protein HRbin17_01340 [bacterium HR17]|uniref:Uncharacterized protein n=1 Tax=Candidatus Fervidibacter japonicus TaxID=2035412 RepID=A0A2H5XCD4_9BACT|nr:hypothetical protein HRbin17_01340 [bacterium HR17]
MGWLGHLLVLSVSSAVAGWLGAHLHGDAWRVLAAMVLFATAGLSLGSLADRALLWLTRSVRRA